MMRPDYHDPNALDNMKPWRRMGCDGDIDDMLRIRLREVGSDEEIFNFFALGLYHEYELDEEGFNVYFERGLRSDEHFNAQEYWLSISREENLNLSRSHASTIRYPVLRVIHKMITYGLCQRTTEMGRMEIRQEAIERIEYRQSYHWDMYQGVFEHMAGVYSVPLQGAYNPSGYAQP
nr:hypothetical protein [Tanacetum cinerariifolium]